ncbi:Sarcalumenin, partial [Dufourea novaeangliae]
GVQSEEELEVPPEDLCRPYIEKALKDLGTGSLEQTSAEARTDADKESDEDDGGQPPASEEDGEPTADVSKEDLATEEDKQESVEAETAGSAEQAEDDAGKSGEADQSAEGAGDKSGEAGEAEEGETEQDEKSGEADGGTEEDKDESPEKVDDGVDSGQDQTEEEKDEKSGDETEGDDQKSDEAQVDEEKSNEEAQADDGKSDEEAQAEDGKSNEEAQADDGKSDEDSPAEGESVEEAKTDEEKSDEVNTEEVKSEEEQAEDEDSKAEGASKEVEEAAEVSTEAAEDDSKAEEEAPSQEQEASREEEKEDSKEGQGESAEGQVDEEETKENEEGKEEDAEKSAEDETKSAEETTGEETKSEEEKEDKSAEEEDKSAGEEGKESVEEAKSEEEGAEETKSRVRRGIDEEGEDAAEGSEEAAESEEAEPTPEEDLIQEIEVPENLRPRDHINQLLKLDEENEETERAISKVGEVILKELKKVYDNAIQPLESLYKYRDLSNRHFGDPEIFSKPLVLFMGPWSGGKSSIINYLLDIEYKQTSLRTGAEPSPAYFNILMHGEEEEILDGTQLAADWTFSGLQKFGQGMLDRLKGLRLDNSLLEKVNIVEIPGILEIRKQVQRLFPFNDACQWFIDRADIIFLVYDPSKLDVGPETEAILDQLKGREYQTRIILNKADQVKPEELMRVQGALIWNISPLMSSAVRVRNHAKMVDCYLTTYYNHKTFFGNKKDISDKIIENPQDYHIYEGLSTLKNISRYDLPDPDVYRDFFRLNALYDFPLLSSTCTYFRGCPINRLDVAIAYDLPELVGKYKKSVEQITHEHEASPPS